MLELNVVCVAINERAPEPQMKETIPKKKTLHVITKTSSANKQIHKLSTIRKQRVEADHTSMDTHTHKHKQKAEDHDQTVITITRCS